MIKIKLKTEYKKSYWNGTGAYDGKLLKMHMDKLIPNTHNAQTIHGELLRCVSNLIHEYNNNGNGNTFGMHNWTALDGHWEEQLEFLINNMDDVKSAKRLKAFVSSVNRDIHRYKYDTIYNDVMDSVVFQVYTTEDRQLTWQSEVHPEYYKIGDKIVNDNDNRIHKNSDEYQSQFETETERLEREDGV